MANCHQFLLQYNSVIRLSDEKRQTLMIARDSLRKRMNDGFTLLPYELKNGHQLSFFSQGSFVMDTIITPLTCDFDLDDGVYFSGNLNERERPGPEFFHTLVLKAITGKADFEKVEDKDTCVRVQYKEGFHIDLPIYYAEYYDCPDLAHLKKNWILSNPIEFIEWFERHAKSGFQKGFLFESRLYSQYAKWQEDIRKEDSQLRRIVRYLKAWADLKKGEMPCGIIMTILATENYSENERDDIALRDTLFNLKNYLEKKGVKCLRPTTPKGEDLFEGYAETKKEYFMTAVRALTASAEKAVMEISTESACENWEKHFGTRFNCTNRSTAAVKSEPDYSALKRTAAVSTPWGKII